MLYVGIAMLGCETPDPPPAFDCDSPEPVNCPFPKTPELDGVWRLSGFRASGVWSKGAETTAASFLGRQVRIDGRKVVMPDGSKCSIVSTGPTRVRDGVETFGSKNGSWKRMGFTPELDGTYKVEQAQFNCGGMFWGITMQAASGLHLLKVWEVYLVMTKLDAPGASSP